MSNVVKLFSSQRSHQETFLPFFREGVLWAPEITNDYARDCATGRRYARELIHYMSATENPSLLHHVVAAINVRDAKGVAVGFFNEIATASMYLLVAAREAA